MSTWHGIVRLVYRPFATSALFFFLFFFLPVAMCKCYDMYIVATAVFHWAVIDPWTTFVVASKTLVRPGISAICVVLLFHLCPSRMNKVPNLMMCQWLTALMSGSGCLCPLPARSCVCVCCDTCTCVCYGNGVVWEKRETRLVFYSLITVWPHHLEKLWYPCWILLGVVCESFEVSEWEVNRGGSIITPDWAWTSGLSVNSRMC